jgi:hypothetical protein
MGNVAGEILKGAIGMIPMLARMVTPELVRKAANAFLEVIEDGCRGTDNKIDDAIVLPICATIRSALNVPDMDGDNLADQ